MNRFAGKFSFYWNDRKLIYFDGRVGLAARSRTTMVNGSGKTVLLPSAASVFIALERMDGWIVLQAYNGEIVACGGGGGSEFILPTTIPSNNPRYPLPAYVAYFDLSLIRAARKDGTKKTRLSFRMPDAMFKRPINIVAHDANPRDLDSYSAGVSNISSSESKPATIFTIEQHADGVTEMQAGEKKVSHFDFRAAGKARVDLSGEDLSGVDFGYSDFTGASLSGTKLHGARFERATFPGASLDRADFTGANFDRVDFRTASMAGTILSGVAGQSCDFSGVDLRTAVSTTPLALKSPEGAPMRFSSAKLKYALLGPIWTNSILDFARIEDFPPSITGLDAQKAVLTGMRLSKLKALSGKFNDATMHAVGLGFATLTSAVFDGARLEGLSLDDGTSLPAADFTQAELRNVSFKNANVSGVSFAGAHLQESVFDAATVRGANFANAYMKSVNFSAVEQKMMHGVNFSRAFLVGCSFQGADLSVDVQLVQAYLHGADFSNAQLAGANMTGAGVASEAGTLSVTLGDRPPVPVKYDATILDPDTATSDTTRCPNGDLGPCANKLSPPKPFPAVWPWPLGVPSPFED